MKTHTFYITFGYKKIDFDLDEVGFNIDDIVMYLTSDKTVEVDNGLEFLLNDYNGCNVHVDVTVSSYSWNKEAKEIECEAEVNFVWLDDDDCQCARRLVNEEDVIDILRTGEASCIVPYTENKVIKGLRVKSFFINVGLKEHISADVLYSEELIKDIDIEQYDEEGLICFNE